MTGALLTQLLYCFCVLSGLLLLGTGVVGSYYKQLELPYWEIAQGITTTTTFGLIGGIGIAAINIAARRGKTALLKKPSDLPEDQAKGFQMDESKQPSAGRETAKKA